MYKKMCRYVILLIGLLIFSFGTAYAVPIGVRLGVIGTPVQGTPFGIEVRVDGVDPLDPLIAFGFNTVTPASWSLIPNPTVALPFDDISLLFNGNPEVAGSTLQPPSGDDILLATLTYRSSAAGRFIYSITSDTTTTTTNDGITYYNNPNQGLFFFNLTVEDLTTRTNVGVTPIIVGGEPVPEPATILLVGFGLLALSFSLTVRKWYMKWIRR